MEKKKSPSFIDPHDERVLALGAHKAPALPEKELAELRGWRQAFYTTCLGLILATVLLFIFDHSFPEQSLPASGETGLETNASEGAAAASEAATAAPTEEQQEIGFLAFLGNEPLRDKEMYSVSPGDVVEVWAYSELAQIDSVVYFFPYKDTVTYRVGLEDVEGFMTGYITLPDYPDGAFIYLYVKVEDVDGNCSEYQQYMLVYESDE